MKIPARTCAGRKNMLYSAYMSVARWERHHMLTSEPDFNKLDEIKKEIQQEDMPEYRRLVHKTIEAIRIGNHEVETWCHQRMAEIKAKWDLQLSVYLQQHPELQSYDNNYVKEKNFMENNELLQAIFTEIKGINTRMDRMETDISGLKTDVSGLKTDVTSLKDGQAALREDVAAMQTDITAMQEDISEIKDNTEITRGATNTMGAWIEQASKPLNIPYPIEEAI